MLIPDRFHPHSTEIPVRLGWLRSPCAWLKSTAGQPEVPGAAGSTSRNGPVNGAFCAEYVNSRCTCLACAS